jgi:hypothetical protein
MAVILAAFESIPLVGIAAGPPATIAAWTGTPQSAATNTDFGVLLVAVVRDTSTNGVQGVTVTFAAPGSGASGTFNGSTTASALTDNNGLAIAPRLRANGVSGTYSVTATVSGVGSSAAFTMTNTGGGGSSPLPSAPTNVHVVAVTVTGPPASVAASSGAPQSAAVNTAFATSLAATVRDAISNPVSGVTVTFTAPLSGASAHFNGSATATAISNTNGVATAPPLTANATVGSYAVTASVAGVPGLANFGLTNTPTGAPPPSTGGTWVNVTPPGFNLDPNYPRAGDNYGVMPVVVDPVRPSDLYAFTNYQGVFKSTDYGLTWTKVSTGNNSDAVNSGRNWAATIDPNKSRNPSTPPTIYTQAGYNTIGKMGIWKSTDGGVNWTSAWTTVLAANGSTNITSQVGTDMQGLSVDPNNNQHLLAMNHGNTVGGSYDNHIFETTNGGASWIDRGNPAGGTHCTVAFITSTTWIATAEGWGAGSQGSFVTTNGGASWTRVGQYGKAHGNEQLTYLDANGTLYLAAMEGIYKSTSPYLSWTQVDGVSAQSVIGTPNYLYASFGWASLGTIAPALRRAPAATGTSWDANYTTTPAGMTNGAMGAAVTYHAATGKYIIVTGNWAAGIWRYVE